MKRNKHVLINLTEAQYYQLEQLAINERRSNSDMVYIIVTDVLNDYLLKKCDIDNSGFYKVMFDNKRGA